MEMSPCGRTDEQTSEYRATQSMDNVRLSFAICQKELGVQHHLQKNPPLPRRRTFEQRCPISCFTDSRSPTSLFISCSLFLFDARFQVNNSVKTTQFSLCNPAQGSATTCNDKKLSSRSLPVFFSLCYQ